MALKGNYSIRSKIIIGSKTLEHIYNLNIHGVI